MGLNYISLCEMKMSFRKEVFNIKINEYIKLYFENNFY